jgi:hypothetical protein
MRFQGRNNLFLKVALDIDESAPAVQESPESTALLFVPVRVSTLHGSTDNFSRIFPCKKDAMLNTTCLRMTFEDYSSLISLRETAAGRPSRLQSSFLRMLYFSAVTISTLGYGDIVPITTRVRVIVTAEIVLGPLLFGFFLNSLLRESVRNARVGSHGSANQAAPADG